MRILIAWLGRAISFALFRSPAWLRRLLALVLAFLWFDVLRIRRQVVLDNIHVAFPEMTVPERVRLGRESLRGLALNFIEYSFLPWLTRTNYSKYFEFENLELFQEALGRGHGVLLLTLHLGHGDLACAALSLKGFPIVLVSKAFKLRWLNDLWFGMRERLGTRFIPARDSSYALLRALKSDSAVVIPLDQFTGPPIGVRTTFFGRETGTAAGLAVMAGRSGAPVLAVYTHRNAQGRHVLHFVREMPVPPSRDPAVTAQVTQEFNDVLESFVRLHPDQWMWIHRRWKRFVVT
jgi:KDO2-lipid IV(A) lauroyltransferase